jgi:hypothetical protein
VQLSCIKTAKPVSPTHLPPLRIIALLTFFAHPLLGGVVLDGSFGTHGALPGPNFMITAPMGKQVGGNLFQSFSQFNLNNSQSATFREPIFSS